MRTSSTKFGGSTSQLQRREQASARTVLVAAICFAMGVGVSSVWFHRPAQTSTPTDDSAAGVTGVAPAPTIPDNPIAETKQARKPDFVSIHTPPVSPAAIEEVKQAVPNFASISLEEGMKILRIASLTEFSQAANQMQDEVQQAQQSLAKAQNGGSEADQQAAIKQLQEAQAHQTSKLQEIAEKSKSQLDALKHLKAANP